MKQLHSKDVWMTFESNGIPPLFQFLVCEVYLPPGNLLLQRDSVWREYVLASLLPSLNEEGKRIYKDDTALKEASATMSAKQKEFLEQCRRMHEMKESHWSEVEELFRISCEFFGPYRYFDTWFSDGAYENREDPATAEALDYAGATKNVMREVLTELFFERGKGAQAALEYVGDIYGVSLDDLLWYVPEEIKALCEGHPLPQETLANRRKAYVHFIDVDGSSIYIEGDEALAYIDAFESDRENLDAVRPLKGMTAHGAGRTVRGAVRIIMSDYIDFSNTKQAMDLMQEREIMVSTTTAPDLLPAMKKAGAIVTDLGGMLSHAAITARELDTPCIVGTKYATQIFKDGDMVEVDTADGIVRRI